MHSMQEGGFSRLLDENGQTLEDITSMKKISRQQELEGVKGKEGKLLKDSQKSSAEHEEENGNKRGKNEREKIKTMRHSQSMPLHQALDKASAQTEVMMEEDVNGPELLKAKPKVKKWKAQARISNQRVFSKHSSLVAKRLASEEKWTNLEAKKKKMDSSFTKSPTLLAAEQILKWEFIDREDGRDMEMAVGNLESSMAEAGDQPRRQP